MTVHGGGDLRYFEERARGGVGLLLAHGAAVGVNHYTPAPGKFVASRADAFDSLQPNPTTAEGISYYDSRVVPMLRQFPQAGHAHGAIVFSQIFHLGAGRSSDHSSDNYQSVVSASPVRDEEDRSIPHELDEYEIGELVLAFGHAARRAREAGIDGVELHAAHGYLIAQFLSPHTNFRTDRYGGSPENRLRFLHEILAAVDAQAGADYPVALRINGNEMVDDGLDVQATADVVRAVAGRFAYVSVSGGNSTGLKSGVSFAYASPHYVPAAHNAHAATIIRASLSVPVIVAGRITTPHQAEQLLADGACDIVGLARALIADPDWAARARRGQPIRPCIGNNECHAFHGGRGTFRCTVNPAAGREEEMALLPAAAPLKVLVAGGGPAGLEAARVAAQRGHHVVLCEARPDLGGQARLMALDPNQPLLQGWLDYLEREARSAGVDIRLSTEVTSGLVRSLSPDALVVATGAEPYVPDLPGISEANTVFAEQVFDGSANLGLRVVVLAGLEDHLRPLTIADLLAQRGHAVEIVSELQSVGRAVENRTLYQLLKRLLERDVRLTTLTQIAGVEASRLHTRNVITRRPGVIDGVDTVVLANTTRSVAGLVADMRALVPRVIAAGDAISPRRLIHAVLDGARAAREL